MYIIYIYIYIYIYIIYILHTQSYACIFVSLFIYICQIINYINNNNKKNVYSHIRAT